MENTKFAKLDVPYQFGQGVNAMRDTHSAMVSGDFEAWLDLLGSKYAESYAAGYSEISSPNLIRKEKNADAYFLTALHASAILYLRMTQIDFDRSHPDHDFVAYMFSYYVGVLEARKYHLLKITQNKSATAKAARLRSQHLEARFKSKVLYFLEVNPQLNSKDLAKLVEKLRSNEKFKALHAQFSNEAQQLRMSSSKAHEEAKIALEKARKDALVKEKRFKRNGFVVPPREEPNIPTLENLYRWFCKLTDTRWVYDVEPKLVPKVPRARGSV